MTERAGWDHPRPADECTQATPCGKCDVCSPERCQPWECDIDESDEAILGLARRVAESQLLFEDTCESTGGNTPASVIAVADQNQFDFEQRFQIRFHRNAMTVLAELLHAGKVSLADIRPTSCHDRDADAPRRRGEGGGERASAA